MIHNRDNIVSTRETGKQLFQFAQWHEAAYDYARLPYEELLQDINLALDSLMPAALQTAAFLDEIECQGAFDQLSDDLSELSDDDYEIILERAYELLATNLRAVCMGRMTQIFERKEEVCVSEIDKIERVKGALHGRVLRA